MQSQAYSREDRQTQALSAAATRVMRVGWGLMR